MLRMIIHKAVTELRFGNVAAYPTESFFALGADATNARAIRKIFRLKGRGKNPIALIAGSIAQVERFFYVDKEERRLMRSYWPGALTILLKPKKAIAADALLSTTPSRPSSGHPSLERRGSYGVGVRVPKHAVARRLAQSLGCPITATSANISGEKPTKLRTVVVRTFHGIVMVHGTCGASKKPSTVVSLSSGKINVLRKGAVNVK